MNRINKFNCSQVAMIQHLRTAKTLDARLLSLDLNRIIKPEDIMIGAAFYNGLVAWLLRDGEQVCMAQSQLAQYLEDLAEL
ncbi:MULTISPECIES: hypothetical protein [Planktothrix]|jgi:hypothetical protein|uniref:Uncharacterized protein n=1 Tax=Planktothrix paucivesiculata PCC 9631 TaxID=671071 RepID=A0A7Z9BLM7_9CYAN|nr:MULTISPECIES: hypothetical protein [Planktothrix]CAD5911173.1 hypothetical protein NO758_00050 [Planktothrix agardhii]VXD16980.1 hypothetical protein PL9631_250126 [Planktothrix paucivesiculata PCC 9631]